MKRQGGFSMVELMVAITLALLLTGAVISVFIGSRTAYQATAGVGEMSDSGRFALNLIGESVRSAGNIACNSAMSATNQNVVPGADEHGNHRSREQQPQRDGHHQLDHGKPALAPHSTVSRVIETQPPTAHVAVTADGVPKDCSATLSVH